LNISDRVISLIKISSGEEIREVHDCCLGLLVYLFELVELFHGVSEYGIGLLLLVLVFFFFFLVFAVA